MNPYEKSTYGEHQFFGEKILNSRNNKLGNSNIMAYDPNRILRLEILENASQDRTISYLHLHMVGFKTLVFSVRKYNGSEPVKEMEKFTKCLHDIRMGS